MEEKVLKTVKKFKLISPGDNIIVGLSGGADSVSLLLALCAVREKLGIGKIVACHINHNLRETAKGDEDFSRKLCEKLNVPFYLKNADINKLKKELKLSEEDAGRKIRYEFFNEIREKTGGGKIATAHNLNDQAETFFMRVLRGSSSDGLVSVKPLREDGVIRPLIEIKREEIETYLKEKNQDYVTDETNFKEDYLRNKIRLTLIPLLKKEFSFDEESLWETLQLLKYDSEYLGKEAQKVTEKAYFSDKRGEIKLSYLTELEYPVLSRAVRAIVKRALSVSLSKKETESLTELIKKGETGKRVNLKRKYEAFISYESFTVKEIKEKEKYSYPVLPGDNLYEKHGFAMALCENHGEKDGIAVEDTEGIIVRTRMPGDKVYIKNTGHKKLQDLFTDKKVPKEERDIYPVIVKGDEIIWVPGLYKKSDMNGSCRLKVRRIWDEKRGC